MKQKKRRQKPHQKEILFYQALQQLSNGYYKTIVAFKLEGKLKLPWTGLNTEQIRYDHRFSPFRNVLAPPPVSYSQYRDMTNNRHFQQNSNQLFHLAMKSFDQAKTLLETINDPNEEVIFPTSYFYFYFIVLTYFIFNSDLSIFENCQN